jgi:hypothetical protein
MALALSSACQEWCAFEVVEVERAGLAVAAAFLKGAQHAIPVHVEVVRVAARSMSPLMPSRTLVALFISRAQEADINRYCFPDRN